jgi:predicted sulfurtransferase
MHKKLAVFFLAFFFSLAFVNINLAADKTPEQLVDEARKQVTSVSIHDVKKMLDTGEDIIILDVRDKEEFSKGHLPGARNISRGLLEFMVENKIPDKNKKVIVY